MAEKDTIDANKIISDWRDIYGKSFELTNDCFFNYMKMHGFPGIVRILKAGHEIDFEEEDLKRKCGIKSSGNIKFLLNFFKHHYKQPI